MVERRERFTSHLGPKIIRLAPNDGVERLNHGPDGLTNKASPFLAKLSPNPSHRSPARFDEELVPRPARCRSRVVSDVESEEVEAFGEVDHAGLLS